MMLYNKDKGSDSMEVTTYSNFRSHLKDYMRQSKENFEPIFVTTTDQTDGVFLSKSEYDNLVENNYIYGNSYYADMLMKSKEEIEDGKGVQASINSVDDLLNL